MYCIYLQSSASNIEFIMLKQHGMCIIFSPSILGLLCNNEYILKSLAKCSCKNINDLYSSNISKLNI